MNSRERSSAAFVNQARAALVAHQARCRYWKALQLGQLDFNPGCADCERLQSLLARRVHDLVRDKP